MFSFCIWEANHQNCRDGYLVADFVAFLALSGLYLSDVAMSVQDGSCST